MKIVERKIQEIGQSLLITLPKEWTKSMHLKKGSELKMMISDEGHLSVAPEFTIKTEKKEAVISFDENITRRFIREYFLGNQKITILFKKINEKERKKFYSFLKKFMDAQIIEETSKKLVIKCFRIEELSIEDCLKRMFYLSLNMIDELLEGNDKTKMQEMEDSLTRFYYLLVMQIRRFLSEGKFTEANQISLLEAMDFRMVAERIERTADIVKNMDIKDREVRKMLEYVQWYYKETFGHFTGNNFEKALPMWNIWKDKSQKYEKLKEKKRNVKTRENIGDLLITFRYAKEISMLIR